MTKDSKRTKELKAKQQPENWLTCSAGHSYLGKKCLLCQKERELQINSSSFFNHFKKESC